MILKKFRRLFDWRNLLRLEADLNELRTELSILRTQSYYFKSSFEVPPAWIDELAEWRARVPIPPQPLVSVCVATYERAHLLLERSLPSVLAQTYTNFELIVVGDGCADNTAAAVASIADPRLRFVNLPERGRYPADPLRRWMVAGTPAMNHALALARGDYVTHLDDDDEYLPERLEKLVEFAASNGCDAIWHPFWIENPAGQWAMIAAPTFALRQVTTGSVFYRSWFTRIKWDMEAHRLGEPGDWHRYRKFIYLGATLRRYPEPLLKHYKEHIPAQP